MVPASLQQVKMALCRYGRPRDCVHCATAHEWFLCLLVDSHQQAKEFVCGTIVMVHLFHTRDANMYFRDLFFLAILSLLVSSTLMLLFTIVQQSETLWVRLLTVATLPAPSLALFLGTVALIVTNSHQWAIFVAIVGYILAMIVALPTQKIIISLWRRIRK